MLTLFNALPMIDRVFDDVMRDTFTAFAPPSTYGAAGIDVRAENDKLTLDLDLPGVKAGDVSVEIEANVLRIRGERKAKDGAGKRSATFAWAYKLPEGYDTEALKATLAHGVLTVEIPRHPKAMPRRVPILTSSSEPAQIGTGEPAQAA